MRYLNVDHLRRCTRTLHNNTAHDCGEHFAEQTLVLIPSFLQDIVTLANVLEQKLGQDGDAA